MEKKAVTAKGHSAAEPQPKKNSPKRAHTVTKLRIRKRIFTAENAKEDVGATGWSSSFLGEPFTL